MDSQIQSDAPPSQQPPASTVYRELSSYPFDQDQEYIAGLSSILGHPDTAPTHEELTSNPDLILQARCFYFARRHNLPPIDPTAYTQWLAENKPTAPTGEAPAAVLQEPESSLTSQPAPPAASQTTTAQPSGGGPAPQGQEGGPPYPTSFAAIVDLITRNVPVPGIEEVPDTVLEHGSSKVDHTPQRRKPWETDAENALPVLPVVEGGAVEGGGGEPAVGVAAGAADADADGQGQGRVEQEQEQAGGDEAGEDKVNGHLVSGEGVVKILQANAIPDSGLLAKD